MFLTIFSWARFMLVVVPMLIFAGLLILQGTGLIRAVPLKYNLRNLVVRWRTTFLTALAFTLVVGLNTVMLAFVNGMYSITRGSGVPGNVLVLADGATDEVFSNLGKEGIKQLELFNKEVLRNEQGELLSSRELFLLVNQPIPNAEKMGPNARKRRFIQVRGIEDPHLSGAVHNLGLHPGGSWFTGDVEVQPGGDKQVQAVLGEGIARELGKDFGRPSLAVGDTFEITGRRWLVKGIMQSSGTTFDSEIWAKGAWVGEQFGKPNTFTTVVLRTASEDRARAVAADLSTSFKTPAVVAQVEPEYYEKLNTTNQQFMGAIIIVVSIMAIGGVFGVMNTMFAAIAQRTKDIGVMRILGYARWQILTSFFVESIFLALLGGALGCALGTLGHGWSATSIMSGGAGGGKSVVLKLVVDIWTLKYGMEFAIAMGCVGGLWPALSAMRLKPLDAVR
jgi:ABC-type antimicrobial peptide transport system permease subunit